jgi:hypothetical protein
LTLAVLVDECADSRDLRRLLSSAGHQVVLAGDLGFIGADDPDLFHAARARGLAVLTKNPRDFRPLHDEWPDHAGLLLVYQDNDPSRDMTDDEIVAAIGNVLAAGTPIAGAVHVLNHWRY